MNAITVVDARMGRGKSSAAIQYMNRYKKTKRFLYVTPYLNEVDRICEQCDFDQSDGDYVSKSADLKMHLRNGRNIAATHSLFYLMDKEAIDLVRTKNYSLIIDESIQVVERLNITKNDFDLLVNQMTHEDEDGLLRWNDCDYDGRFRDYKGLADSGSLRRMDNALLNVMNPDMLRAFDEVFMLTYLFDGQYQKAYLDFYGFAYRVVGVHSDENGHSFSDAADVPPPEDYEKLIHIFEGNKNNVGNANFALSKNWFSQRGYDHPDIKELRNGLRSFFRNSTQGTTESRIWTTFKDAQGKLVGNGGRFGRNFLQISARATNEYRDRTDVAYLANRFIDPNIMKFFASKDLTIDADVFALSEMLQWIWRSAIRDGKPINLYLPSRRMRALLVNWIKNMNYGGNSNEQ